MGVQSASISLLRLGRLERRPELDALRGLFLVWMTLTHLPTHVSELVNQSFGFLSSAEGFVSISALLIARLYLRQAAEDGPALRAKLQKRALRLYGYHVTLLLLAFTFAAAFAVKTHRAALLNLLNFYLAHPFTAVIGSLLLIYCPPLLDILPMYITFLLMTPYILSYASRRGWTRILFTSFSIWALAQFGLRTWVHDIVVRITHLHIPLQETGAFNLFAWQLIWVLGMWIGARSAEGPVPFQRLPRFAYPLSVIVCLVFLGARHGWFGPHLDQQALGMTIDKWQIGPLRLLNFAAFACLLYWIRRPAVRVLQIPPLVTLGRASLEVFCAHLIFVFTGLALLYGETTQLQGAYAVGLITLTFAGLLAVALRQVRPKKEQGQKQPVT